MTGGVLIKICSPEISLFLQVLLHFPSKFLCQSQVWWPRTKGNCKFFRRCQKISVKFALTVLSHGRICCDCKFFKRCQKNSVKFAPIVLSHGRICCVKVFCYAMSISRAFGPNLYHFPCHNCHNLCSTVQFS